MSKFIWRGMEVRIDGHKLVAYRSENQTMVAEREWKFPLPVKWANALSVNVMVVMLEDDSLYSCGVGVTTELLPVAAAAERIMLWVKEAILTIGPDTYNPLVHELERLFQTRFKPKGTT